MVSSIGHFERKPASLVKCNCLGKTENAPVEILKNVLTGLQDKLMNHVRSQMAFLAIKCLFIDS